MAYKKRESEALFFLEEMKETNEMSAWGQTKAQSSYGFQELRRQAWD